MSGLVAIVAEGGGQRGIYTAGVLDAFLAQSFNPFTLGVGVSSGSQNLLAYFLEQPGYAKRVIVELTNRADFVVPYRCFGARSIMDLDGYFDTSLYDQDYLMPYHNIAASSCLRRLQFVATDRSTLESVYLEPDKSNVFTYLKASSAVPYLYRSGVSVGNQLLLDGGVSDPIPVEHAYNLGARHIVLIKTRPEQMLSDMSAPWRSCHALAERLQIKPALFIRMLACHESAVQQSQAFIEDPPADLRLHVIAPPAPLKSRILSSLGEHLYEDYQLGMAHGRLAVNKLSTWLDSTNRRPKAVKQQHVLS